MKASFSPAIFPLFLAMVMFFTAANGAWAATELEQAMKKMAGAYKELSNDLKQPQDANKAQYVALAVTIKDQAQVALDLVPKLADTLPGDQRATMIQAYQRDMSQLMQNVDSLSEALKNGKWDDANKLMTTLHQEMVDGHKAYRVQKGDQPQSPPPQAQTPAPSPSAVPAQ